MSKRGQYISVVSEAPQPTSYCLGLGVVKRLLRSRERKHYEPASNLRKPWAGRMA